MTEASPSDGTRLRLARQARGLSQQQLASMAGVTRQAVSAVESGHSDPSLRVALGLARALGVTVEELFGPGELGDPVLAQPVRVQAAPVPGWRWPPWATGSSRCRCTRTRPPGSASLPAAWWRALRRAPEDRCRSGRSARRGPRWWWRAATRRCRCSRRRSAGSTPRSRSPGGRVAAARPCGWPPPGWCTPPVCTQRYDPLGERKRFVKHGAPSSQPDPRRSRGGRVRLLARGSGRPPGHRGPRAQRRRPTGAAAGQPGAGRAGARPCSTGSGGGCASNPAKLPGYDTRASGHLQVAAAIAGGLADAGVSS